MNFMKKEEYIVDVSFILFDNDNYNTYITTLEGIKK